MSSGIREWLRQSGYCDQNGLLAAPGFSKSNAFAELYVKLREKEGRILSGESLARLPEVSRQHPLYDEWKIRGDSARRFCLYLGIRKRPFKLLDIGCGNGWLSAKVAEVTGAEVLAVDVNEPELRMATDVFAHRHPGLTFALADVFESPLPPGYFDFILLSASVQYFPALSLLLTRLRELLAEGGEIHILDSPFYSPKEQAAAHARTEVYFSRIGFPELAQFYHHHSKVEAIALGGELQGKQGMLARRIYSILSGMRVSPFPWWKFSRL